jgi:hypothetical protein
MRYIFPFRADNRKPNGTWRAPDATQENIKGTSVDPYDPVWPRWRRTPPRDGDGEFVSDQPFFDIDEITQNVEFYSPERPLADRNVDGNPASRQRVHDMPHGNHWRRRLLVAGDASLFPNSGQYAAYDRRGLPDLPQLAQAASPPRSSPQRRAPDPLFQRQPMPDEPGFWAVRPPRGGYGDWGSRYPFYMVNGETNQVLLPVRPSDEKLPSPDIYPPARNGQPPGDGVPDHFQRGAPNNPLNDYLWPYLGF